MEDRTEKVELMNICVVVDDKGRVLVQDKYLNGEHIGLIFPGGHLEKDESIVNSVKREIYEETGLLITDPELCGVKNVIQENKRLIIFLYKADKFSGYLRSSNEGKVDWVSIESLKDRDLAWNMKDVLSIFFGDDSELYINKDQLQVL